MEPRVNLSMLGSSKLWRGILSFINGVEVNLSTFGLVVANFGKSFCHSSMEDWMKFEAVDGPQM
jgi:hypothetical protein